MKKIISILLCISMLLGMAAFVTAAEETKTITFDNTSKRTVYNTAQQVWVENGITVTNDKAASSTNVGNYSKPARFYASSSITVDHDGMTKIVFNCNNTTYANALKTSIGTVTGATVTISSKAVTVTFTNPVDTFKIAKLSAQVRVDSINVTASAASCDGTNHVYKTNKDETHHWKECECGVTEDKIPHASANGDYQFKDSVNHWGACECGALVNVTPHSFTNGVCACGAQEADKYLKEVVVGGPFKLGLYNGTTMKQYYGLNKMDSHYMATTDDINNAPDVYVEETEGGYYLYYLEGETKTYIDIYLSGTYKNVGLKDAPNAVYTWSDELFTFVTNINNNPFCMGTHGTYTTFNTTDIKTYLSGDKVQNLDKTQYVAHLICTHTWADATCTAPKTCTICGATEGEALGHSYSDATCTTPKTCTVCGATDGEALGHSYSDATCTTPKTCTVCGATDGEALGHTPGAAATCTTDQICTICKEVLVKGGHVYDDNKICTVCKDPAPDHEHDIELRGVIAATCTKVGYSGDEYCKVCNKKIKDGNETPMLPHTEVVDTGKAPTCTETGLTDGKHCSVCNTVTVKQEVIDAKGHTEVIDAPKAPTCTATGLTEGKHCSVCNEVIVAQQVVPAKNHTPGDPATCTTAQTCSVCNAVLTAATGHSFANGKCTVCQAADPDYVAPTEPEGDGNTTSSNVMADNSWADKSLHESFTIGSNITVSVSATPVGEWGQNSGKFYTSDNSWRIYQNETPAVTIAAGTGKIVSVKVDYKSQNGGILTLNGQPVESGAVVEVNAASVVFGVANSGEATNGQARITGIEVIHTGPASSTPEETKPEATEPEATEPEETKPVTEGGEFDVVTKPAASEPFKFGMTQKNLENAVYYLKGGMDGYYMATTTDINEAIDVYLEETEGGYHLYTMVDGTKTYINMVVSGTHVNGAYEAAASTVYTLKNGTLVATVEVEGEAAEYWFGTRNDKQYTTMGPCKTSYEGFYGQFYGTSNPETADTFSSIVFALMALSAIGAGVVISKKKEF